MMRSLTRVEYRWARAALGAIYPSDSTESLSLGICDLDIEGFLADLLGRIPLMAALGLRAAIWIVALGPIFLLRRFVTVVRLDRLERQALVGALSSSSIYAVRQLVMALKATGGLLFGAAASVRIAARGGSKAQAEGLEPKSQVTRPGELLAAHTLARRSKEQAVDGIPV
jgi:hypothetical protein